MGIREFEVHCQKIGAEVIEENPGEVVGCKNQEGDVLWRSEYYDEYEDENVDNVYFEGDHTFDAGVHDVRKLEKTPRGFVIDDVSGTASKDFGYGRASFSNGEFHFENRNSYVEETTRY